MMKKEKRQLKAILRDRNMIALFLSLSCLATTHLALAGVDPSVIYTSVPAYDTIGLLRGQVTAVDTTMFRIVTYIRVGDVDWYIKPTEEAPTVPILGDGSFEVDINTGDNDRFATEICSFVIPAGLEPPPANPSNVLPEIPEAVASITVHRDASTRTLFFGGREWKVKRGDVPIGPGPNYFSDRVEDVWVDGEGIHLTITFFNGEWRCTEVILNQSLGYGTYNIVTKGRLDQLEPAAIFGIFTWDSNAPAELNNREIDIVEHAKWGDAGNQHTSQFAVQPCDMCPGCGQCDRFSVSLTNENSYITHLLTWQPGNLVFKAFLGRHVSATPPMNTLIHEWSIAGPAVRVPGTENIRFNFHLFEGMDPGSISVDQITVTDFSFSPVWVDFGSGGEEHGTEFKPFNTFLEGADAVLSGGRVKIKGDTGSPTSDELLTLTKPMTIEAVNGSVQIGQTGSRAANASDGGFVSRPIRD